MNRPSLALGLFAWGVACTPAVPDLEPAPRPDTSTTDDTDVVADCDLVLEPPTAFVLPRTDVAFSTTGGTGDYVYELSDDSSGGLISATTGRYLSGDRTGGIDVVTVRDEGCPGDRATARVTVFEGLSVAPAGAWLPPGTRVQFDISGGSGDFLCRMGTNVSDGSVSGCVYVAGPKPGIDSVEVVDTVTGQVIEASFQVDDGAVLGLETDHWAILVDEPFTPQISGGSGVIEATVVSGVGYANDDGHFVSPVEGRTKLSLRDHYTGMLTELTVDVLAPRNPGTITADGEMSSTHRVFAPGDLNGDGFDDAVLLSSEAGVGARQGGAIQVYAGGSNGLSDEAVFEVFGTTPIELLGRRAAVGDFDGDGEPDLVAGSLDRAGELLYAGAIAVYGGVEGGFFTPEPVAEVLGERSGDRMGHGLAACDFNGDGFDDLAVSAYAAEDENVDPVATNQGVVDLHLGGPAGVQDLPDVRLWGRIPDGEGGFIDNRNMLHGRTLETGDVNGDGLCDLLVGNFDRGLVTSGSPGAVFVHLGTEDGVNEVPDRIYAVLDGDTAAHFGRAMATGDVDGDGADEVLIGAWRRRNGSTNWGQAVLFRGGEYSSDEDLVVDAADADWWVFADNRYDYLGYGVDLADVDGDGLADVLVGSLYDEAPGRPASEGTVRIYEATTVSRRWGDFTGRDPDEWLRGDTPGALYGQSVRVLGDVDGDGVTDVGVLAGRANEAGPQVGALYVAGWDSGGPGDAREAPMKISGDLIGNAGTTAWVDPRGRGKPTLMVGAPYSSGSVVALRGEVVGFEPGTDGFVSEDDSGSVLSRPYLSTYDREGWNVSNGGDTNGDGIEDLVVISYTESRPGTLNSSFTDRNPCGGSLGSAGLASVYLGLRSGGFESTPARVQWGPRGGGYIERASEGLDFNGDGYSDVAFASQRYNSSRGGFSVMRGGPGSGSGTIDVSCDDVGVMQSNASTNFGNAIAALGDLDGDGCDELGVTALYDDIGVTNGGSLRIFWGWGGPGCPRSPEVTTIHSRDSQSRFGQSVAGGRDVTGDRVPDIVVGGYRLRRDGSLLGAAVLLSGSRLIDLPRQSITTTLPSTGGTVSTDVATLRAQYVWGPGDFAFFGQTVALLPGDRIAVGAPYDAWGPTENVGRVRIYRIVDGALQPTPEAIAVGPALSPGARFGTELSAAEYDGKAALAIGAVYYDGDGVDEGGVFAWELD